MRCSPRWRHDLPTMGAYFSKVFATCSTTIIDEKLYVWGGYREGLPFQHDSAEKLALTSFIEEYDLSNLVYSKKPTEGNPPNGVMGFRCCAVENRIYYFGGRCKTADCYHNDLFTLDLDSRKWVEIPCNIGPIQKSGCGMISFTSFNDNQQFILVLGGVGFTPDYAAQSDSDYVPFHQLITHLCYTNEVHIMCVSSSPGAWSVPEVTGDRLLPTAIFSFDYISENKAILFGGFCIKPPTRKTSSSNDVYIVTFNASPYSVNFERISKPEDSDIPWPIGRAYHSTTVIHSQSRNGSMKHYLLVLGGVKDGNYSTPSIPDCWIMDIEKLKWKQIPLPETVTSKIGHSITSYSRSVDCVWILIAQSGTVSVVELVYSSVLEEWTVANVVNDFAELDEDRITFRSSSASNDGESTCTCRSENLKLQEEISSLKQQMKETNEEITVWMNELESMYEEKISALKKEHNQKISALKGENADQNMIEKPEEENQPWIIQRDEVELTNEKLGNGAYGVVQVAIFRGTRVAAKTLHDIIVSNHNRNIFIREKEISSRVHHPNIVQFIGAIRADRSPLILLYELMTTSLYDLLQTDEPLSRQQIIDICKDVLSAMCYIHLWLPHPIIHRDISSPNVLLEPLANNKWRSKLSDFGAANLQLHVKTAIPGNAAYAAPEADNPKHHSPAMDVYSFGILTTEMILHEAPSVDDRERVEQCLKIKWLPVKNIVLDCISANYTERPTSIDLLNTFKKLIVF